MPLFHSVPYCSQFLDGVLIPNQSLEDINFSDNSQLLCETITSDLRFKPIRAPGHVCGIAKHWQGSRFN